MPLGSFAASEGVFGEMLSEGNWVQKEPDPHVLNPARCANGHWRLVFIGRRLTPEAFSYRFRCLPDPVG